MLWNLLTLHQVVALDFGDLRDGRYGMSGLSDSHGGLEVSNMANLKKTIYQVR